MLVFSHEKIDLEFNYEVKTWFIKHLQVYFFVVYHIMFVLENQFIYSIPYTFYVLVKNIQEVTVVRVNFLYI